MTKKRLTVPAQQMRELMFASGGYCSMRHCQRPLTGPSGGWIGTVAHIVAAEDGGPRSDPAVTPQERCQASNLMLMCANHGREVDDKHTGEQKYPVARLRQMKAEHEATVTDAVADAIAAEQNDAPGATRVLDTLRRRSVDFVAADGLLESTHIIDPRTGVEGPEAKATRDGLLDAQHRLEVLSRPALDILQQLLSVWILDCERCGTPASPNFGEPSRYVDVAADAVNNRVLRGQQDAFDRGVAELVAAEIIEMPENDHPYYRVCATWAGWGCSWPALAAFLWEAHDQRIDDWLPTLNFALFDLVAAEDRNVQWR